MCATSWDPALLRDFLPLRSNTLSWGSPGSTSSEGTRRETPSFGEIDLELEIEIVLLLFMCMHIKSSSTMSRLTLINSCLPQLHG